MNCALRLIGLFVVALLGFVGNGALAQIYPIKPIRVVVPYTPGGPVDTIGRLVASALSEGLPGIAIVENRPGADTIIGTETVVRSTPDGYTLLIANPSITMHPSLYTKLPYNAAKDLTPVGVMASASYVVVVHPSVEAKNIKELISGPANRGDMFYGSPGPNLQLAVELFKSMSSSKIELVEYSGGAPAMTALVGGQVQFMISPLGIAIPQIKSGRVRAIATTGFQRSAILPDLPTVAEAGLPGYDALGWYGVVAPTGTPKPTIDRLSTEIVKAVKLADTQQKLITLGMDPMPLSAEQMDQLMTKERIKWARVIKEAKIAQRSL